MTRPPIQKYMLHNMVPTSEESKEKFTYRRMRKVVRRSLQEIGFSLPHIHLIVESFGVMPDEKAASERRFWATFQVDLPTAQSIFDQRKGRREQTKRLNLARLGVVRSPKCLKLKQFKGTRYEAVKMTLWKAAKVLARSQWSKKYGFELKVVKETIRLTHDQGDEETVTLTDLIVEHRDVFNAAIQNLPEEHEQIMRRIGASTQQPTEVQLEMTVPAVTSPAEIASKRVRYPVSPPTARPYRLSPPPSPNVSP